MLASEPPLPESKLPEISERMFQVNAGLMQAIGFAGVQAYQPQERSLRLHFEVRPEFCHSGGRVAQGGFVTAWLDAAMAHVVIIESGGKENLASLEIKVSFLSPVAPGKVVAHAKIIRKGKRVAFLEANLLDGQGKHLASATSTALVTPLVS